MGKTGLYQDLCERFKEDKKLTKWWFELYVEIVLFALLVFVFSTFYGFFPTEEPIPIKLLYLFRGFSCSSLAIMLVTALLGFSKNLKSNRRKKLYNNSKCHYGCFNENFKLYLLEDVNKVSYTYLVCDVWKVKAAPGNYVSFVNGKIKISRSFKYILYLDGHFEIEVNKKQFKALKDYEDTILILNLDDVSNKDFNYDTIVNYLEV